MRESNFNKMSEIHVNRLFYFRENNLVALSKKYAINSSN